MHSAQGGFWSPAKGIKTGRDAPGRQTDDWYARDALSIRVTHPERSRGWISGGGAGERHWHAGCHRDSWWFGGWEWVGGNLHNWTHGFRLMLALVGDFGADEEKQVAAVAV